MNYYINVSWPPSGPHMSLVWQISSLMKTKMPMAGGKRDSCKIRNGAWNNRCSYIIFLIILRLVSILISSGSFVLLSFSFFFTQQIYVMCTSRFPYNIPVFGHLNSLPYLFKNLNKYNLLPYPILCLNIARWVENDVDPDETPRSHLGLHCLLRPPCPNTYGRYGTVKRGICKSPHYYSDIQNCSGFKPAFIFELLHKKQCHTLLTAVH